MGPMLAAPRQNRAVALMQRRLVATVQDFQPRRPVLVQPLREASTQTATRWVPITEVPKTQEIWTRTITLNELVFDIDVKPWASVVTAQEALTEALDVLGVPRVTMWSGGKGAHTHVFLDGLTLDEDVFAECKRHGVDVWRVARVVVANAILDAAEVPDADDAATLRKTRGNTRWAPPHGEGMFDRTKISWDAERSGSMVRVAGCAGSAGFRKTLAPEDITRWPKRLPREAPLRFPALPFTAWRVPEALRDRVKLAIEAELLRVKEREGKSEGPIVPKGASLKDAPCLAYFTRTGAPSGARHFAFLDYAARLRALGYSRAVALRFVRAALSACGGGAEHEGVVDEVYAGRWSPSEAPCECTPGSCVFARRAITFTRKRR